MKILVLSDLWLPFPGGAERLAFNIARDLHHRDGFDVRVVTGYAYAQQFDGPPFVYDPGFGVFDHRDEGAQTLARYLDDPEWRPDVIVTHHLYAFQYEPELAASGIPVVQIVLNNHRLACAGLAVFISRHVAEMVGGRKIGDLMMIPPAFEDVVSTSEVRPFDREAVGFIKPIPHKGVDLVYAIAAGMPDTQFLVLRGEWQTLETLTELPNLDYMEPVDDIRDFYAECRIVLMPSITEDAGTVAQECAMNGIPCISSNAGGLPQTNAGGIRLDSRERLIWAHAIRQLGEPIVYDMVTHRQRQCLDATGRDTQMDLLADAIRELVLRAGFEPATPFGT